MDKIGELHKKAWEFDAYNFWVRQNGTPEERARADKENLGENAPEARRIF